MTIRVWLIGYVLLFVGVELVAWVLELGSSQPGGYWVMLGGLGLAAASNFKHLPKLNGHKPEGELNHQEPIHQKPIETETSPLEQSEKAADRIAEQSTNRSEDSISFRVRMPWR